MRWKSVALVGAAASLGPGNMGCHLFHLAARNVASETHVVATQHKIEHELKKQANEAWKAVRADYPRKAFSAEFREGFIDGYVDYLDRGGNGSMPAVPPGKLTRHPRYFTENGQCLVKDYFVGFKYGQEIAIATGKRQFMTVPVLLPQTSDAPPAFRIEPRPGYGASGANPTYSPEIGPGQVPVPPQGLPLPTPLPGTGTVVPPSVIAPPPSPPLPRANEPAPAMAPVAAPATAVELPEQPFPQGKLPAPPSEVPDLPPHVPTPSTMDELPVVPPTHTEPPVVPPSHPEAAGN